MAQVKQPKLCGYNWYIKVKWSNQNCVVLTDVLKYKVILCDEILSSNIQ